MNPPASPPDEKVVLIGFRRSWFDGLALLSRRTCWLAVTLACLGGAAYLVFWRDESGWLFLPAYLFAVLLRPKFGG